MKITWRNLVQASIAWLWLWSSTLAAGREIHISAAASLREVLNELTTSYSSTHNSIRVRSNFGASGTLAVQIENGAPTGIFISANKEWVDYLIARGRVKSSDVAILAYNTLVFAGLPDSKVTGFKDLPSLERIAIGSPKSVPAGQYAMEALNRAGVASVLKKKLILARDVRDALAYVTRGEVDGAFVYRTDVPHGEQVRILFTVAQELYSRATYQIALTSGGASDETTKRLFNYLVSAEAQIVLKKHGFALE